MFATAIIRVGLTSRVLQFICIFITKYPGVIFFVCGCLLLNHFYFAFWAGSVVGCLGVRVSLNGIQGELTAAQTQRDDLYAKQSRGSKYNTAEERDAALRPQVKVDMTTQHL